MKISELKEIIENIPEDYELMDIEPISEEERKVHSILVWDNNKEVYISFIKPKYLKEMKARVFGKEEEA